MKKYTAKKLTGFARLAQSTGSHWHAAAGFKPSTLMHGDIPPTTFEADDKGTRLDWEMAFSALGDLEGSRIAMHGRQASAQIGAAKLVVQTAMRGKPQRAKFGSHEISLKEVVEIVNINK